MGYSPWDQKESDMTKRFHRFISMNPWFLINRYKRVDVCKGISVYTYTHFLPLIEGLEAMTS